MDKNAIYLEILRFAKAAVEDEIRVLNDKTKGISSLNASPISPDIYAKIRFVKRFHLWYTNKDIAISEAANFKKIANLERDSETLNILINDITTIMSDTSKDQATKDADIVDKMIPFFNSYGNVYEGTGKTVDVVHGQSQFNKIVSRKNNYLKLKPKYDDL